VLADDELNRLAAPHIAIDEGAERDDLIDYLELADSIRFA